MFILPIIQYYQDASNYNELSPALEEVTGHKNVRQLTFPSPIHIHPPTKK